MSSIAVRRISKVLAAAVLPLCLLLAVALPGCGEGDEPGPGDSGDSGAVTDTTGSGATDNVAACNAWLSANQCGDYDFSQVINCQMYAGAPCDVSAYFDCLTDNTTCMEVGGMSYPDMSGWGACSSLVQCQ
jgi:hypothetical protein